jgi:hypothetical protein
MFKEIGHDRVNTGFSRAAARVRNACGATAIYDERVKGELRPPEFASSFFYRLNPQVWTFGQRENEEPPVAMLHRGRDGR